MLVIIQNSSPVSAIDDNDCFVMITMIVLASPSSLRRLQRYWTDVHRFCSYHAEAIPRQGHPLVVWGVGRQRQPPGPSKGLINSRSVSFKVLR